MEKGRWSSGVRLWQVRANNRSCDDVSSKASWTRRFGADDGTLPSCSGQAVEGKTVLTTAFGPPGDEGK